MPSTIQDCDCGFIDSNDPTKSTFTSLLVVNFSSIPSQQFDDLFLPATYEISQRDAPYSEKFSADQVQLSEAGLELTVSPSRDSKNVPCSQIFTRMSTFFYGSYSAQMLVRSVPGTVTAFFNYKNDSSEVDIEYLSAWNTPTLLYSVKPQIYLDNGTPANSTYQQMPWSDTSGSFDQDFHQWSYVWLPDVVHYGLDADYSASITTNVPQAPGRVALNHWSNGNPNYSLGPPTQNSTITVASFQAIYNDTRATALACKKATSACTIANGILQGSIASGGRNSATLAPVTLINSAYFIGQAAPRWLLVLFILFWFGFWHAIDLLPFL